MKSARDIQGELDNINFLLARIVDLPDDMRATLTAQRDTLEWALGMRTLPPHRVVFEAREGGAQSVGA